MEEKEKAFDERIIAYLKSRSLSVVDNIYNRATERENIEEKEKKKKPPPIRLFPTIRIRNKGVLSPQLKELYETKKELTSKLETVIRALVQQEATLTECENYAWAFMKKAPKKFRVNLTELKAIVRVLYESLFIPIPLEIRVGPDDWQLFTTAFTNPADDKFFWEELKDSIEMCIASELSNQEERKKARGPNRKRIDDLNFIKREASKLYGIMKFLCALSPKERPAAFNKLINGHKAHRNYFTIKGNIDPELFTAFLLSRTYRKRMEKNNILKFFDIAAKGFKIKDFRRTYLIKKEVELWKDSLRYQYRNVVKNGNAKYLIKKGQKYPHAYTDSLARRDDMDPCDRDGNLIQVSPSTKKGRNLLARYLSSDVTLILPYPAS